MKKQINMLMRVTALVSTSLLIVSYRKLFIFCCISLQKPLTQNKCQDKLKILFQHLIIHYQKHTASKPIWEHQLNDMLD